MSSGKSDVIIDHGQLKQKLERLFGRWKNPSSTSNLSKVNCILSFTGKVNPDETNTSQQEEIQLWLTGYQFPETLFLFIKDGNWIIVTSPKKASYLEQIKNHYDKLEIIQRIPNDDKTTLEKLFETMKKAIDSPVFGIPTDKEFLGDFASNCRDFFKTYQTFSVSHDISSIIAIRTDKEVTWQHHSGHLTCGVMKFGLINVIENVLDTETHETHSSIAKQGLTLKSDSRLVAKLRDKFKMDYGEMEILYTNVQSGNNYSLRIGAKPTDEYLSHEPGTILVSVCSKYHEYSTCMTRTLILDGTKAHKDVYAAALKILSHAVSALKPGVTFSEFYHKVYQKVSDEYPGLLASFNKNIGHSIGLEFKDNNLLITADNKESVLENNMAIFLSIGFFKVKPDNESKEFSIWLCDTVLVRNENPLVLTDGITKLLDNISYELEQDKPEKQKVSVSASVLKNADSVILKDRLRRRDVNSSAHASHQQVQEQLEKQKNLREKKLEEIKARYSREGNLGTSVKKKEYAKLDTVQCFQSPDTFPRDFQPSKIFVDYRGEAVMLPINGYHVPLSILSVKNVSCNMEDNNKYYTLRLNLQVPGSNSYTKNDGNPLPDISGSNVLFIKELIFRSSDGKHIQSVFKGIKDLFKSIKQRESDAEIKGMAVQDKIVLNKTGKRILLKNLMARPNIQGARKTVGSLEAHENGFRYTVNARDNIEIVDISYENIKYAIFQPCDHELIVLLHFHMKNPILVGKKKSMDFQVYSEAGTQVDDLDNRRSSNYHDPDEQFEEMRERELRRRLNSDFKNFVTQCQQMCNIKFDLPYRELMFTGVPLKSNVEILPTANCLLHLIEWPPFILELKEIEIVSLERIQHGLRNFDMIFVFQDYTKPVKRIDLIPVEFLDVIKQWLNELGIVWYEGKNNLQWTNILRTILSDVESFVENGGFDGFLGEGDSDEDNDMDDEEMDGDEEFDIDSEEEREEEESEYDDDESLADESEDEGEEEEFEDDEDEEEDEEELVYVDEIEEKTKGRMPLKKVKV